MKREAAPETRLAYSIPGVMAATSFSRNRIYLAISRGELQTFKDGKRRYATDWALRDFVERLAREGGV